MPRGVGFLSMSETLISSSLRRRACQSTCKQSRTLTPLCLSSRCWAIWQTQGKWLSCISGGILRLEIDFLKLVSLFSFNLLPEAKVEVAYHKLENEHWTSVKPLVFVLDAAQEPTTKPKKKGGKGASQISSKNFGSWISLTKLKTAGDTLKFAWRCRFPCYICDLDGVESVFVKRYWILIGKFDPCKIMPCKSKTTHLWKCN